ncbi:MAG TPA: MGMT family protein [Pyrinomonadaceae bacterium]|nr:MGMT family protein [Pyrinomonadaceae bacterium]
MKSLTSWREKLEKPQEPKVVDIPPKMARFGSGTMLIPTPKLVDDLIRKVPKGKLVTVGELRRKLAAEFEADVTCPLTTGIFVRIAAEAAEEDRVNGLRRLTPYWRVVKDDGSLSPGFPGGAEQQTRHLRAEGFAFDGNGKKPPTVKQFERNLHTFK